MKAIRNLIATLTLFFRKSGRKFKHFREKINAYIDKNPNRSFYIFLGILLLLIVLSNIIGTPKQKKVSEQSITRKVDFYSVGKAPSIEVLASIEKSGVVTITALSPGVVQAINRPEGSEVARGSVILSLATNYQGGNTSSLQRELAQQQYQNVTETYEAQKELIKKQKEIAEKSDSNSDELRDITDKSVDETNDLISLNTEIISSLDTNIGNLESTNVGGANDALILSTKTLKSQFVAGTNAARQGVRMAEYSASGDKPLAGLSNLQKDIALKQLEVQEKMLDLNKEISGIQLKIAYIVESLMFPASPFAGTVQRISVKVGQAVTPGTELAVIAGDPAKGTVNAVAYVTRDIANKISRLEGSNIHINSTASFKAPPLFISDEPVRGTLHAVYFRILPQYAGDVSDKGFISIDLPIGYADTGVAIPYIPLDSVYQTKDLNYVFIENNGTAKSIPVELGDVFGSFVEVKGGLASGNKIIVNRNVIAGDKVQGNAK